MEHNINLKLKPWAHSSRILDISVLRLKNLHIPLTLPLSIFTNRLGTLPTMWEWQNHTVCRLFPDLKHCNSRLRVDSHTRKHLLYRKQIKGNLYIFSSMLFIMNNIKIQHREEQMIWIQKNMDLHSVTTTYSLGTRKFKIMTLLSTPYCSAVR
jgi:hypothetical protein